MDPLVLQAINAIAEERTDSLETLASLIADYGEAEVRQILAAAISEIDERIGVYKRARETGQLPAAVDRSLEQARALAADSEPREFTVVGLYLDQTPPQRWAGSFVADSAYNAQVDAITENPEITIAGVIEGSHEMADDDPSGGHPDPAGDARVTGGDE